MPSESGVTSSSSTSLTSPASTPPWIAAPIATTSSGFTLWCGSLPKSSFTFCCTSGMRVEPPTSTTSSISPGWRPASAQRLAARLERALDEVVDQLLELRARELQVQVLRTGLVRRDVRQIDVRLHCADESSIFAFSAASRRRCIAIGSLREVDALVLLELVDQVVDHALVEVVAAEVRVAVGRLAPRRRCRRPRGSRCRRCRRRSRRRRSSRPSSCRGRRRAPPRSAR